MGKDGMAMTTMKCPHCGWTFTPVWPIDNEQVPEHYWITNNPHYMSAAALQCGATDENVKCPGTGHRAQTAKIRKD